jgi:hypothetical protein
MIDETLRLRTVPALRSLLTHYADLGTADRESWQDRLMDLDGLPPRELVQLHGELLAYGWIEQNTGHTPTPKPGAVPGCYRVTSVGQKVLKWASEPVEEAEAISI